MVASFPLSSLKKGDINDRPIGRMKTMLICGAFFVFTLGLCADDASIYYMLLWFCFLRAFVKVLGLLRGIA